MRGAVPGCCGRSASRRPVPDYVAKFCACRPVIERGHESVGLASLLQQGASETAILTGFRELLDETMAAHSVTAAELQAALSRARDHWIASAFDDWIAAQGFYAGVVASINALRAPRVVITTKPERFARQLARSAGLDIEDQRIFGLETIAAGSKRDVLESLLADEPGTRVHFFEDRLATLEPLTDMTSTQLYLVDWGYNTPEQSASAAANPDIKLLSLPQFKDLLAGA